MDTESLVTTLGALMEKMDTTVRERAAEIEVLHPRQKESAINLLRYLTLRTEDIRSLQDELHLQGLSSLASSESHIYRQIQAVMQRLGKDIQPEQLDFYKGREVISNRAQLLFGTKADQAIPYLMVTFDTGFADDLLLVKSLLQAGMNTARINCAHDNEVVWRKMIDRVHEASRETGICCKIYMDLGGPKMRVSILGQGKQEGQLILSTAQEIRLAENDAVYDPLSVVIGCDEGGVVQQLSEGERIFFDDGLFESEVISVENRVAILRINRVSAKKSLLKSGKGINFPDTRLELDALTSFDRDCLPFICEFSDLIGYSFVRRASDLQILQRELAKYNRRPLIILKIETPEAVSNLPSLLFQGMQEETFGVMIARGDLAIEIGFERMSEIQEEILWISEAGHVPVIWATQVLDTLNKAGIATRSEATDAAHAGQSECVMINKGDHTVTVLQTLSDILRRSGGHHVKKRYTFRPMGIASRYINGEG
jgi:pyruvate kinase